MTNYILSQAGNLKSSLKRTYQQDLNSTYLVRYTGTVRPRSNRKKMATSPLTSPDNAPTLFKDTSQERSTTGTGNMTLLFHQYKIV